MFGFCEECRDMVKYHIVERKRNTEVKGEEVEYMEKIAICNECKEEIFIHELRDENLLEIDRVYREERDLITIIEIENLLERYDIGKRPLSKLLGWGEVTITRYIDGQIPNKEYSDRLYQLFDLENMKELLDSNGDNISEVAVNKVEKRIKEIEEEDMNLSNLSKLEIVSEYIVKKSKDITPLAIQKLLYYIQGFSKVFLNEFIFKEDCQAWVHGPVYKDIYFKYENYRYNPIDKIEIENNYFNDYLTIEEIDLIDSVLNSFAIYSGKVLEEFTHHEEPWIKTRRGLGNRERSNRIIEKKYIYDYFKNVKRSYDMVNILDIKDYSIDMIGKIYFN